MVVVGSMAVDRQAGRGRSSVWGPTYLQAADRKAEPVVGFCNLKVHQLEPKLSDIWVYWGIFIQTATVCALSLLSATVVNTMTKTNLVTKGFISLSRLQPIMKWSQGRNWSGVHGKILLTGLLSWLTQHAFLYSPRSCARGGTTHGKLGSPTHIIN